MRNLKKKNTVFVEFAWKLYAVRNSAEDRATVVESLILKERLFSVT